MSQPKLFTRAEWSVLLILAGIQFVNLLDFVIMMPLGPRLIERYEIRSDQFPQLISAYGIAAGIAAFIASTFLDRFDRKQALLVAFAGFILGTLWCGFANSYFSMLGGRIFSGIFGGVLASLTMTCIGDIFPVEKRGRAMGVVMSSFALVSVVGIPLGLLLADLGNPLLPFQVLVGLSLLLFVPCLLYLPTLREHIGAKKMSAGQMLLKLPTNGRYLAALGFSFCVVGSGFLVIPFIAVYCEQNLGVPSRQIKWLYLVAGACTFVSMNVIGKLVDHFGHQRTFRVIALLALSMALLFTQLPVVPFAVLVLATAGFMVFTSGRAVPAQSMLTGVAPIQERAGFMSLNACVQNLAMGVASLLTGWLVQEGANKELIGFPNCGYVSAGLGLASIGFLRLLQSFPARSPAIPPVTASHPAVEKKAVGPVLTDAV